MYICKSGRHGERFPVPFLNGGKQDGKEDRGNRKSEL